MTPHGRCARPWSPPVLLAVLSGAVAAVAWRSGRRGVDLAAQLYRVEVFHRHGFTLWDSQWYSGHWNLDYSVLYPPLGALVGMGPLAVATAVVCTAAFDRLVVRHFGPAARAGSVVFAFSVVVEVSIGQLAFFTGEAFALVALCCLVGARRHWIGAALFSLAATLTSPLAGAFAALAVAGWAVSVALRRWTAPAPGDAGVALAGVPGARRARLRDMVGAPVWGAVVVVVAALAPIAFTAVVFPGQGPMPYPVVDWAWEAVVAGVVWFLLGPGQQVIRTIVVLYLLTTMASVAVPSALGGNVGRLEDIVALPLVVVVVAVRRAGLWRQPAARAGAVLPSFMGPGRWGSDAIGLLAAGAALTTIALSQWSPAFGALTAGAGQPWNGRGYFTPMASWIESRPGSGAARVEVVPTEDHGEAAYVAPGLALARGWERQLDIADNPLFYGLAPLEPATYLAWLRGNGVGWVALSTAPQDPAGVAEARLLSAGVPGLRLVWHDAWWRVWRVTDSGIVTGPARLTAISNGRVSVVATRAGTALIRVRWAAHWQVIARSVTTGSAKLGPATVGEAPGGWVKLTSTRAGPVSLIARPPW